MLKLRAICRIGSDSLGVLRSTRQVRNKRPVHLILPLLVHHMATGTDKPKFTNELSKEKSPYLLQHAHNPVNWYPWGNSAFQKARDENKPIFLSVGYSTCHWCHVMEHESFEDEAIAAILNEHFIPIKVDREERPDVDKVYMTFIQATVGGGGWPMSVWLTPELKPFYGGTYFPPSDQFFRPGFGTVLKSIAKEWNQKQSKIVESGANIIKALQKATTLTGEGKAIPPVSCRDKLAEELVASFDANKGGFGGAPKFPQPVNLNFLLRYFHENRTTELGKKALSMCVKTLKEMEKGGIHDHVCQGFHRYSTDSDWHVPHFEKMLYDQGQLAVAYSEAYMVTRDQLFADTVKDIVTYVNRDLSHAEGGFFSAEDADSYPTYSDTKKCEGAFCVWKHQEIQELLSANVKNTEVSLADLFSFYFGVERNGNVKASQDPHGELTNENVLIVRHSLEETADHFHITMDQVKEALDASKKILQEKRKGRPPPHLDTKMLTSWNGLMISGLCKAYQALGSKEYLERAVKAATFVQTHLYQSEQKRLLRSIYCSNRDGPLVQIDKPVAGFIDDYAFMIRALLDLYESSFEDCWLEWATELQETQDDLFWDDADGGYFEVTTEDPTILLRMKEAQDGAEPSPNSVSVSNLIRLSVFLNKQDLKGKASKLLSCFQKRISQIPIAVPEMICGLSLVHRPPEQIVIVGNPDAVDTKDVIECIHSKFLPNKVLILVCEKDTILKQKLPSLQKMTQIDGKVTVYICQNYRCTLPLTSVDDIGQELTKLGIQ